MRLISLIIISILLLISVGCFLSPEEPEPDVGAIIGTVVSTNGGESIVGASVSTNPSTSNVLTDNNGRFSITKITPGQYNVLAEKDGFTSAEQYVNVSADHNSNVQIELTEQIPGIALSTTSLNFGTSTTSLNLSIYNETGYGELQWAISESEEWLSLNTSSGTATNEIDIVTVQVDRTSLSPGSYNTQLQVTTNVGELWVDVAMSVQNTESPQLSVSRETIDFGEDLNVETFTITNSGIESLQWTIMESVNWLAVTPASGTTTSEQDIIVVSVDRTVVSIGTYSATIIIQAGDGGNASISVSMQVTTDSATPVTLADPSQITQTGMTLVWSRSELSDFASYKLYRSTSMNVTDSDLLAYQTDVKTENSYTDTGLNPGTTYYYRVYVVTTSGAVGPSNEVSASTTIRLGSWASIYSGSYSLKCVHMFNNTSGYFGGTSAYYVPALYYYDNGSVTEEVLPIPSGEGNKGIIDLAFFASNNGYAIADDYTYSEDHILHYDGISWTIDSRFDSYDLECLEATSGGDLWIGLNSNGLVRLKNDGTILEYDLDVSNIYDISAIADDAVYCLDYSGKIFRFNGLGWSLEEDLDGSSFSEIHALDQDNIWVTNTSGHIYQCDGNEWNDHGYFGSIYALCLISGSDIWVGGSSLHPTSSSSYTNFLHYDGNQWTNVVNPTGEKVNDIQFIDGIGWAVDDDGNLLRYSTD